MWQLRKLMSTDHTITHCCVQGTHIGIGPVVSECVRVRACVQQGQARQVLGYLGRYCGSGLLLLLEATGKLQRSWGPTLSAKERAGTSVGSVKVTPHGLPCLADSLAASGSMSSILTGPFFTHRTDETLRAGELRSFDGEFWAGPVRSTDILQCLLSYATVHSGFLCRLRPLKFQDCSADRVESSADWGPPEEKYLPTLRAWVPRRLDCMLHPMPRQRG